METLEKLQKGAELYQGFILPKHDALQLRVNEFEYDEADECFRGYIEDAGESLRQWEYYPTNFTWCPVEDEMPNY